MKLNKLIVLIVFFGCKNKNGIQNFSALLGENASKTIIISCIRCSCTIDDLNKLISNNDPAIADYRFIGDTTCLNGFVSKKRVVHVSQKKLDSISTNFYNLLIYNPNKKNKKFKMLKTEDSENLKFFL